MIRARLSKVLSHTFILYMQKWVIFWCFLVFRFAKPPFKKKRRKHRVVLKIENNEFYWPPFESLDSKLEWQSKLCDPIKKEKIWYPLKSYKLCIKTIATSLLQLLTNIYIYYTKLSKQFFLNFFASKHSISWLTRPNRSNVAQSIHILSRMGW